MDKSLEDKSILLFFSFLLVMSCLSSVLGSAYASSPSFARQEVIDDGLNDWVDVNTLKAAKNKPTDISTDIVAVDYFSDGKTLNATLWLNPLRNSFHNEQQTAEGKEIHYGMLIDSDDDNKTGYQGIDYQIEVTWNNKSQTWTKTVSEWSPTLVAKPHVLKVSNYTSNPLKSDTAYVLISSDLSDMLYPSKYKIIFYGEIKEKGLDLVDFTPFVRVPPPEIHITTSPSTIQLRQGENKTIDLIINSTKGFAPLVYLYDLTESSNVKVYFKYNPLHLSSYGLSVTPLTIFASKSALIKQYTLLLYAKSIFPSVNFTKGEENTTNIHLQYSKLPDIVAIQKHNPSITQANLVLSVMEPLSLTDQISDFWNKLGAPLSFVYGIIAGISPWVYQRIREHLKKRQALGNN